MKTMKVGADVAKKAKSGESTNDHVVNAVRKLMIKSGTFPDNHYQTDAHNVFGDNWRVNVWTVTDPDRLVPTHRIEFSYFLKLDKEMLTVDLL